MSVTQQQVISLLENVLFESATLATANAAAWEANAAATSVSSLAAAMAATGEEKIAATVVGYYISALGRAPTAAEVSYYVGIAEQGLSASQIAAGDVSSATWNQISEYFSHSPEFLARGGLDVTGGLDQTGLLLQAVPWLYESVLGRAPTTAEVSYYDTLVINGTDISTLFRYFTSSAEFHTDTDTSIAAALASFGEAAVSGGNSSLSTVSIGASAPSSTPPTAATFGTLTTGTDTINDAAMSGAHTYTAILGTGATLNAGDTLIGNGLAELDITDSTELHVTLAGALTGIQTISIDAGGGNFGVNAGPGAFDVSAVTGLTTLEAETSGSSGDYITATSSVDVTLHTESANVTVTGFHTLTLYDISLNTVTLSGNAEGLVIHDAGASVGYTLNLVVDGLTLNGGTFDGIVDAGNTVETLNISATTGTAQITGVISGAMDTVTVTGDVRLGTDDSHTLTLASSVTTLDLSGDTHTADTNYVTLSSGAAVTLGTNNVSINAGGHIPTITVGLDGGYDGATPNLIVTNAGVGTTLAFASVVHLGTDAATTVAGLISDFYSATPSAGDAAWTSIGGNIYIVESATGAAAPSATDTVLIEIVGGVSLTSSGSDHYIHL